MFRVGLTGGIASGKSTVSQLFSELGINIIDTDIISHQLMQINHPAYVKTVDHFGNEIVNKDGTLNRPMLRKIIFDKVQQKSWLEDMIHPLIRQEVESQINKVSEGDYVLVVVPLMFETEFNSLLDHIIAIDCPAEIQLKRLIQRDSIDEKLALNMISSQMDNPSRLNLADSILQNSNNQDRHQAVLKIHQKLVNLARQAG